jgi:hypothetical protein
MYPYIYTYIHTYRYGYIGRNGCGKSTFMKVIAARCFPIPDGIDIFHLSEEVVCMYVCMFVCMVVYILIYFFVKFSYLTMPTGYQIFLIMYISMYVCMQ